MIFCCGHYHSPQKTVSLLPNFLYRERKLEVVVCPDCGALIAVLTQYNVSTKEYETYRPKRKRTADFIRRVENGDWDKVIIKHGTRERAGFIFGLNRQHKNGKIYQYAVNFNGDKKLVKVIG